MPMYGSREYMDGKRHKNRHDYMDWTTIISALMAALIPTGGLLAIVTIKERKTALQIDNQKSIAESYRQLADEYREREAKTQELMASKEAEVLEQVKLNSSLRHKLDDAHTETAVCRIMYCRNSKCIQRDPPFGSGAEGVVCKLKEQSKAAYEGGDEQ